MAFWYLENGSNLVETAGFLPVNREADLLSEDLGLFDSNSGAGILRSYLNKFHPGLVKILNNGGFYL